MQIAYITVVISRKEYFDLAYSREALGEKLM